VPELRWRAPAPATPRAHLTSPATSARGADPASAYLLLGLRLGRHVDGLVDFYYGPPELRDQVDSEPLTDPRQLGGQAAELADQLAPGSEWLREQLKGIAVYAGVLAGDATTFADETEGCYGVRSRRVSEDVFAAAHEQLDALLPGDGPLGPRFQGWREQRAVPREQIGPALEALVAALREWTRSVVHLPDGESVAIDLVRGEPWLAFNYYLGELRSRVAVNDELPLTSDELVSLVAHEAYPGHHTEHALKEAELVCGRGLLEESIALVPTPQPLVSEGIAKLGEDLVLDGAAATAAAEALAGCGIDYDRDHVRAVLTACEPLAWVGENAALMLHVDGVDRETVSEYIERWRLLSRARAQRAVVFLTDPTWRAYSCTYVWGKRLCAAWLGDDVTRFVRLLTEQITVRELLAADGAR